MKKVSAGTAPTAPPATGPDGKYVPQHPIRIVTAASLFDGHDAAINIMRRILQATGAEVIHLGHNRSVSEIVNAAVQEDVQAIAVSSYQGGHNEYFRYMVDLLKEAGSPHIQVFGGGGGTITPSEIRELETYGVTRLYSPEDGRMMGLQGIINDILMRSDASPVKHVDFGATGSFSQSHRALAQALTCIEAGQEKLQAQGGAEATRALVKLKERSASASGGFVVGLTGTGGAGKSSLTDELVLRILESDAKARVAVLAIDPTRRKTGGALLGDRLRMNSLSSPRTYMRSLATRASDAAISAATRESIALLRAAGFDWILVETGGIGQADTSVTDLVDVAIYVMTSEYGASTQLEKINMLDYADLVVLNKFDKGGTLDALDDVRKQLRRNHLSLEKLPVTRYPVVGTIASRFADPGVDLAFEHILYLRKSKKRREPLTKDFHPESLPSTTIVPRERLNYLSDIARSVRQYKETAKTEAAKVAAADAAKELSSDASLSPAARQELEKSSASRESAISPALREALAQYPSLDDAYRGEQYTYKVRDKAITVPMWFTTLSQNHIRRVVTPRFQSRAELARFLLLENLPGYFPYTAGVFPFKRDEEDPKRMFAGEGTPERTNRRFHLLCKGERSKRLSTAFDSVTLYGEDPDERPDIFGKIGESGVSVCTLDDAKKLYAGFDLCDPLVSVSMTINGPAPVILAFFMNTAIDQKLNRFCETSGRAPSEAEREKIAADVLTQVRGTVQADILKEDQAQNTCIFSTAFALRMMGDIQHYFVENNVRNYYSVSISGYHIAEAGANPITQLALTLSNGFTYVEYYRARGMSVDSFAPNLSFFFSNALDPEYTVVGRVARRIWAVAMRDLYGANDRSQKLKYHIQTSGRSLHAQEIAFNDIRTTLQALLAMADNCNSLHTNAYDEAITTPTEESVRRAMAIQLIIAREFGVMRNENPLQGSYFLDELTEIVEEAVLEEFDRLSARGGVLGAMELQYQRNRIQEESLRYERAKHSGEMPLIGVNTFLNPDPNAIAQLPTELTRATYEEKRQQIDNLRAFHKRHEKEAPAALARLKEVARNGGNLFAELMATTRVCSLGQISHALYEVGGKYRRSS